ncbi:MAG: SDR family oxidoreductase [Spirochaetia bacterium]
MNVFVTGGSRGIGRFIVLKFVREGYGVAFTYVGNEAKAVEVVEEAKRINPEVQVKCYRMDVKSPARVEEIVDQVITEFDTVTAVVNNAGIVRNNAAALMSDEEWTEVIDTNLSGPFWVIRSFLMHFISNRKGRIINISSLSMEGCSGQVNYAASKAGLIGLTNTIAREYGSKNITANIVTVGYVETDLTTDHMVENLKKIWMEYCPMRRIGSGEEIAAMVHYLTTDEAGFINGEVIRVAGGLTYVP